MTPTRLSRLHSWMPALVIAIVALTARCALADTWSEHSYATYGFALSSASEPTAAAQDVSTAAGPITLHSWSCSLAPQIAVIVFVNDYPAGSVVNLDGALAGALKNLPGGRVITRKPIVLQGVSGIDADLAGDSARVHLRIFSRGVRMWQILSISPLEQASADAERISASFRFTP